MHSSLLNSAVTGIWDKHRIQNNVPQNLFDQALAKFNSWNYNPNAYRFENFISGMERKYADFGIKRVKLHEASDGSLDGTPLSKASNFSYPVSTSRRYLETAATTFYSDSCFCNRT